jgi:metal-responsive CopG/Arc/MetJ family transcriptional regulator
MVGHIHYVEDICSYQGDPFLEDDNILDFILIKRQEFSTCTLYDQIGKIKQVNG